MNSHAKAAELVVRELFRLAPEAEVDDAAVALLSRAIACLEEGHAGALAAGASLPGALVGGASGEGKPFVLRDGVLRTARIAAYEEAIEAELRARSAPAPRSEAAAQALERYFPEKGGDLREREPRRAAEAVLDGRIAFIVGGPGRGKTYTLRRLLAMLFDEAASLGEPAPRVALAAPTGKAAARMREALGEKLEELPCAEETREALRALEAKTLHRLLGIDPSRALKRTKRPPRTLEADVVVVDEGSMVDLPLFSRLLGQTPRDARLVVLGDPGQLASVGVGSILGDVVASGDAARAEGVPGLADRVAKLTVSYRFSPDSGIAALASALERGDADEVEAVLGSRREDLAHHTDPARVEEELEAALVEGFRGVREALAGGASDEALGRALAAFDAHRVLSLTYEGELGVHALNERAAAWLVGAGFVERRGPDELSVHPVLVTENDPATGLMNGDVGLVVSDQKRRVAAFPDPAGGVRRVPPAVLPAHQTAFAMTVHKAQGSQFGHVSLVFPSVESRLATRELFYTGVTRAMKRLSVHGELARLRAAALHRVERVSGLRERLHPRA